MHTYCLFNLHVHSELALPGLPLANGTEYPGITIRREAIPKERLAVLNDDGDHIAGRADGVMRFRVENGTSIVVDIEPDADEQYVAAIVTGELMSVLLRQRGLLTLHGSCVAKDGEAVGFIGNSGWGKSTLATCFLEHGYELLGDDVMAIDLNAEQPEVIPAHPQIKLRPDSGERFIEAYHTLAPAHTLTDKRLLSDPERFRKTPTRLKKVYILEGQIRAEDRIVPLSLREAFAEIVGHTRGTRLLKNREYVASHFTACSELLQNVPVARLHRTMSLELLPELYYLIEQDLTSLHDSMVSVS